MPLTSCAHRVVPSCHRFESSPPAACAHSHISHNLHHNFEIYHVESISNCPPPNSLSRTICHINTHKFPRLSSSNWHLIGHLVNVSLLWLVWFLFPAQGWHWNRTFPPCSHSSILPNVAFSKSPSSAQLVLWAHLSCDVQNPWDSSVETSEWCQAGIPNGMRNNVIARLVSGSVNIWLNKTVDIWNLLQVCIFSW